MNACNTCIHNPVCDHNIHGFEDCGNYINTNSIIEVPDEEDLKIAEIKKKYTEDGK
jgi:hypothetical protein